MSLCVCVFNKVAPYRSRCALHALVAERPSRYTKRRAGAAARARVFYRAWGLPWGARATPPTGNTG